VEGWATASSAGSRRYADVATSLRLEADGVSLDLVGGRRQGDLGRLFWGQVRAATRIAGPVWFEAGAGRYPPDATGFLHGVFANAGLRIGLGGRARTAAASDVVRVGRDAGRASAASPTGVAVRFTVEHTTAVGVAGEWTEWVTVPLEVDGRGRRVLRTRLRPGVYRFVLVSAEGRFFVPAGVTTVPDDFGGVVGLLVVRE
jgi:hypothetical protein